MIDRIRKKIKAFLLDKQRLREIVMYVLFGVLTTLVNWVVYFAVTKAGGLDAMDAQSAGYYFLLNAAQIIAWIAAVLFAFFTNKRFVFESKTERKGALREFVLFVSARLLSLAVIEIGLFNLLLALGFGEWGSKLIESIAVIVFNYIASKLVVFKKRD